MIAPDDQPVSGIDGFVAGVHARRLASGQPESITEPVVYSILDGLMAEHRTASVKSDRRRRAVRRSQVRTPYT